MNKNGLTDELKLRWDALAIRLDANRKAADAVVSKLLRAYGEEGRHYHGLSHLKFLFGEIDRHAARIEARDRLELAAWFHDWVYDTQRNDNEARSADTALEMLADMDVSDDLAERVASLIRMTKTHTPTGDQDDDLFLDMDFAILGAAPTVYDAYAANVRKEYGWVPLEMFNAGRVGFLRGVLDRPRIFLTDTYEDAFGKQARENIAREIERLMR
tara:strand:+ start:1999 stop:2643 length:645 start_codon:yes stop_codon:yes gene_type:complete